jgi:ribonuclease HI
MATNTGIPQGSPLSPIFYLFYNSDLLDETEVIGLNAISGGYIYDICILTHSSPTEENCRKLRTIHERCTVWANKHASKFDLAKYKLLYLTRIPNNINMGCQLEPQQGVVIEPQSSVKYLGVWFDTKMAWNEQIAEARKRVSKSVIAIGSIAASTWGIRLRELRQLYMGVVVPQLTYGASVWYSPLGEPGHKKKFEKALNTVQNGALRAVTGAFKATSAAALQIEAYIPPMRNTIAKIMGASVLQIMKSAVYDDILRIRQPPLRPAQRKKQRIEPPLEKLTNWIQRRLPEVDLGRLERVSTVVTPPWWEAPVTRIDTSKEEAQTNHDTTAQDENILRIYTDGNGINNKIGAAAVAPQIKSFQKGYMGPASDATVYAAEVYGVIMALHMMIRNSNYYHKGVIFTDNQAAIRSISAPGGQSGQYLINRAIYAIEKLKKRGFDVQIHWIPAHTGVAGNEAADRVAKEATGWRKIRRGSRRVEMNTMNTATRAHGYVQTSTCKQKLDSQQEIEWKVSWTNGTEGSALWQIRSEPSARVLQTHQCNRPLSTMIVQLRTGKIGLRQFLYRRKVPGIENPKCPCGLNDESVSHVLLHCRRYEQTRREADFK